MVGTHLVGIDQGCCQTSCSAQGNPTTINSVTQNITSAQAETSTRHAVIAGHVALAITLAGTRFP